MFFCFPETCRPRSEGNRPWPFRICLDNLYVYIYIIFFQSNLRKVKVGPVAKPPSTRRCRILWAVRVPTPESRLLLRGTTPWSTPPMTMPPSPGPWRMPPGKPEACCSCCCPSARAQVMPRSLKRRGALGLLLALSPASCVQSTPSGDHLPGMQRGASQPSQSRAVPSAGVDTVHARDAHCMLGATKELLSTCVPHPDEGTHVR